MDARPLGEDREPWRDLCGIGGAPWYWSHTRRARVVRSLRASGYRARRWPRVVVGQRAAGYNPATRAPYLVDDWRYSGGPAEGLPAVDPWDVCHRLSYCGGTWRVWLRAAAAGPVLLPLPDICRSNACPVCAARTSWRRASSLRLLIAARWGLGVEKTAFVTLTQRARRGERLSAALARWRGAWSRLTRGRSGTRWRALAAGWFYGVEVTRGAGGSHLRRGPHWHVHGHAIVRLHGVGNAAREAVAKLWRGATVAAARAMGYARPEHWGWDRISGGGADGEDRWWRWFDGSGWHIPAGTSAECAREIAHDRIESGEASRLAGSPSYGPIYQAAKYPTPIASLCPLSLAEWLAVARGRRWHDGGGIFRGAIRQAEDLAASLPAPPVDLGSVVCRGAPGEVPRLDRVAEGIGVVVPHPSPDGLVLSPFIGPLRKPYEARGLLGWRLLDRIGSEERAALSAAGLELIETADGWLALLPTPAAHDRIAQLHSALQTPREE